MCKGADSIMLPRCSFDHRPELDEIKKKTVADLHKFAVEGLRTLVMG
jgi:magnesium-transporting ATPase (P-type)